MQARAIATRERLLHSAAAILVQKGYSGTSTAEVCRHAEVSRGTLQYHFPTRQSLLIAAVHYVLTERVHQFVVSHTHIDSQAPEKLIRDMWQQWQGPPFYAWLELAVAARTEPTLRAPLAEVMAEFDALVIDAMQKMMGAHRLQNLPPQSALFVFAAFNGLAVDGIYSSDDKIQPMLDILTDLATLSLNSEGAP